MRIEVFNNPKDDDVLRVRLEQDSDVVRLVAVGADGARLSCGLLLTLTDEGLHLHDCVSRTLGLALDGAACLEIVDD